MANGFAKLKDGSWGVRIEDHRPAAGEWVDVQRKDGTLQKVQVKQVVWSGPNRFAPGDVHLCEIIPQAKTQAQPQQAAPTVPAVQYDNGEDVPF